MTAFLKWLGSSPIGAAFRVFVGVAVGSLVTYLGSGGTLHDLDVNTVWAWVGAALAVALPVLIAWVNPQDGRFGVGS